MRIAWILLLGLVTGACRSPSSSTEPVVAGTPEEALQGWAQAFVVGDVTHMMSFYGVTDDVRILHSVGLVDRGAEAIRQRYTSAFDGTVFEEATLELTEVRRSSHVAWATGEFRARSHQPENGSRWQLAVRTSFVLEVVDGAWKIALEQSTPVAGDEHLRRLE